MIQDLGGGRAGLDLAEASGQHGQTLEIYVPIAALTTFSTMTWASMHAPQAMGPPA